MGAFTPYTEAAPLKAMAQPLIQRGYDPEEVRRVQEQARAKGQEEQGSPAYSNFANQLGQNLGQQSAGSLNGVALGSPAFYSGAGSLPSVFGGTSTVGGGTMAGADLGFMSSIGGPSVGMGGGAGSGAGGSGAFGSLFNPWTALAAVVVGNELQGRNSGRRSENPWEHFGDALTGRVVKQDADHFTPKIFGKDELGLGADTRIGASLMNPGAWFNGGIGDAWDDFRKNGTLAKAFKGIF